MPTHEITIDEEIYTITEDEYGHIIKELKMTDAQLAILNAQRASADAVNTAKIQEVVSNLPSWQVVSDAIDAATTIAQLKVIVKKMARALYLFTRNSVT